MKLVCDNCGKTFGDEQELMYVFPDIPGLIDRLDAGGTVPNGECPDCGSLVYMGKDPGDTSKEADASPREFLVEWSINVCADTFRQAAEEALRIQRDTESIATVFDVSCPATGIRHTVDLGDDKLPSATFRCRVCGDRVATADMRSHLCGHNPNADGMEWESVREEFDQHDADMAAEEGQVGRVVIVVRGGVTR